MTGLARWCIRHKKMVLFSWTAMLVALAGVVGVAGSAFSDSFRLPASDSTAAYNLLALGLRA
jgi:RND superfamily putative drug exporter